MAKLWKLDPIVSTVAVAGVLALLASVSINWAASRAGQPVDGAAFAADGPVARPQWAASATGRIEPKDGEVRISSEMSGRITRVGVKVNDQANAGDPLVLLDDDELHSKFVGAEAEVLVRERERDEEQATGLAAELRTAEDAAAAADRAWFKTRIELDDAVLARNDGSGKADAVKAARSKFTDAEKQVADTAKALKDVQAKKDLPLPTRLESALTQARSDLKQIENAIDRTRLRAPSDGAILAVWAKVGELAAASPEAPLVLFGDVTGLRVRAELEERDVVKVRVGQRVVIRSDAYPGRDFEGTVTQIASALGAPRITSRGPRRPNDIEVLEVLAVLDGQPPLLTGMRVDVFFRQDQDTSGETPRPQADATVPARK